MQYFFSFKKKVQPCTVYLNLLFCDWPSIYIYIFNQEPYEIYWCQWKCTDCLEPARSDFSDIIKKRMIRGSPELRLHQRTETNKGFQIINLSVSGGSYRLLGALFLLKSDYQNTSWVKCLEGCFFFFGHSHIK